MTRATYVLAGTTLIGLLTSVWLWLDNRSLREDLADRAPEAAAATQGAAPAPKDPWLDAARPAQERVARSGTITPQAAPSLPEQPKENRNDRRARRNAEISALFGRLEGESEEEWKKRVFPLFEGRLNKLRDRTNEMRKAAEEQAGVTKEQSAQLDKVFEKTYAEVVDFANEAITDGRLSPYKRDVGNWLELAGGLGTMLNGVQGQIGKVLSQSQIKAMYDSGFEWSEYIGLHAPWEKLRAPPPPPK
ncbi:MAG TPA: hypothetical protein VNO30_25445 [Kofleriaceae bacterium]|nr:hypothetical protein [Kofleriaceae bacterium]